jgi:hypothetical protein
VGAEAIVCRGARSPPIVPAATGPREGRDAMPPEEGRPEGRSEPPDGGRPDGRMAAAERPPEPDPRPWIVDFCASSVEAGRTAKSRPSATSGASASGRAAAGSGASARP